MRSNAHGGHIALTLCLVTAGLLAVALALPATGLFGDANPIGIAMFLALFLGVPAAFCAILALLSLAAKPPWPTPVDAHQYMNVGDIAGTCPNCEATIPLDSLVCSNCSASFGEHAAWRVRNHAQSNPGTHA